MQSIYFVRHADGSFSEANQQPQLCTISGLLDTPEVATESGLETENVGGGFGVGVCGLQR